MKFPICNKKPERAPKIFGYTFILCWRCLMVTFGFFSSYLVYRFYYFNINIIYTFLLMIPMILDGSLQYFLKKESTNLKRAITGFVFGIGYYFLILIIFNKKI